MIEMKVWLFMVVCEAWWPVVCCSPYVNGLRLLREVCAQYWPRWPKTGYSFCSDLADLVLQGWNLLVLLLMLTSGSCADADADYVIRSDRYGATRQSGTREILLSRCGKMDCAVHGVVRHSTS